MLKYSDNYFMTSGSLWNHYRDEVNDDANEKNNDYTINNERTIKSKSEYEKKNRKQIT